MKFLLFLARFSQSYKVIIIIVIIIIIPGEHDDDYDYDYDYEQISDSKIAAFGSGSSRLWKF